MQLDRLVDVVGKVRATTKKTEKTALLADFLRQTQAKETELATLYLTGTLTQGKIGVGWRMVQNAMGEMGSSESALTLMELDGRRRRWTMAEDREAASLELHTETGWQ